MIEQEWRELTILILIHLQISNNMIMVLFYVRGLIYFVPISILEVINY